MTDSPLPPAARTPLWEPITEGAKAGELRLQTCDDCGTVQYPPREVCGNCLSDALRWGPVSGAGRVLSNTTLTASIEPWFHDRLPVNVVSVKLDAGPVVYAFADGDMDAGAPVRVEARIDAAGVGVLHASKNTEGNP